MSKGGMHVAGVVCSIYVVKGDVLEWCMLGNTLSLYPVSDFDFFHVFFLTKPSLWLAVVAVTDVVFRKRRNYYKETFPLNLAEWPPDLVSPCDIRTDRNFPPKPPDSPADSQPRSRPFVISAAADLLWLCVAAPSIFSPPSLIPSSVSTPPPPN